MTGTTADRARLAGWLDLAARGWHLVPIAPGAKRPAIRAWEQRATTDPETIVNYFTRFPDHNAGIACGPSGLLVIDCDTPKSGATGRDGWDVLTELAAGRGGLPSTWTVTTPSGGRHLYFRAPAVPDRSGQLGNTARALGPMLDSRGHGGQVLAPGSRLPNGGYELTDDTDPAALPGWLAWRLSVRPSAATSAPSEAPCAPLQDRGAYVSAVVRAELQRVAQAERGGHNTAVFTAARALGQLVGAGALDHDQADAELTRAAAAILAGPCDCTERDVAATIASGLAYGARRPRRLPHLSSTRRPADEGRRSA